MATWRALLSPNKNISFSVSHKESLDNRIVTQIKARHAKTITQSTNLTQNKPTIRREHSESIDGDQAFIQSSSKDFFANFNVNKDKTQLTEIKQVLMQNSMNLKQLHKNIDKFDYNQRQIQALQKQILHQRSKYSLSINTKINQCQKKIQDIQLLLLSKK
ncbi:unnamed protein product (macronuclear) [Paramecium tetraurelia]|uniref:Uncharacterized protein n=1 Tax=Paramecium tetraurelia TaxID=5888 RepID=A0CK38_PARTE|nr:uncharacterized protein GSPATT00000868001 [Paramecium tetraurelia]CAK71155.1 unnamed protein product [Paramecium tetraurelia]|eukprot:XP_001438552.1 hypothetical protein (macronuclear) [Paramecium tetraurelia strain d4-2]